MILVDGLLMKILPCPFCGKQPDFNDPDFCHPVTRKDNEGKQIFRAGCTDVNCGAEILGESQKESIERWNARIEK